MLCEVFDVTEVDAGGEPECLNQQVALAEELGLDNQVALLRPSDDQSRMKWRKMTRDEEKVYKILCPKESKLREFADSPFPVRILEVIREAQPHFDELLVWSTEDADLKDPMLVGIRKLGPYSEERYLLARWGDELAPFSQLRLLAGRLLRSRRVTQLREVAGRAKAELETATAASDEEAIELPSGQVWATFG